MWVKTFSFLLVALGFVACASVTVEKIPDPGTYMLQETCQKSSGKQCPTRNEIQIQADAIKGIRYYLPRPYILVKKEFPVDGGTFFLKGTLDANKNLKLQAGIPEPLIRFFPGAADAKILPLTEAKVSDTAGKP